MMQKYACVWLSRFQFLSKNPVPIISESIEPSNWEEYISTLYNVHIQAPNIDYLSFKQISFTDIPLASVDFHCTGIVSWLLEEEERKKTIIEKISNIIGETLSEEEVKKKIQYLIWTYRSSISTKTNILQLPEESLNEIDNELKKYFLEEIEPELDKYSRKRILKLVKVLNE